MARLYRLPANPGWNCNGYAINEDEHSSLIWAQTGLDQGSFVAYSLAMI